MEIESRNNLSPCFARLQEQFDYSKVAEKILKGNFDFIVSERGTAYGGPKKTWRRIIVRKSGSPHTNVKQDLLQLPVFQQVPELVDCMEAVAPLENLDQVLLTRVEPQEGLVARHTDIALDRDKILKGVTPNTFMRFHLVLQSNPGCTFHVWDLHGNKQSVQMKTGEVWYTDVRKPHAIDNKGDQFRLHLVCDWKYEERLFQKFDKLLPAVNISPEVGGFF